MDINVTREINKWDANFEDEKIINKFLAESKKCYEKEFDKMELDDDDKIYFAWSENYLHIYLVRTSNALNMKKILVLATPTKNKNANEITYIDKFSETDNTNYIHASEDQQETMLFEKYGLNEEIKPEKIIKSSVYFLSVGFSPELWINRWIDNEMHHTKQHFSIPPIKQDFNNLGLHPQKFKIEEIINNVNDEQFTRELEECMKVFEQEYYYPAAAGLGGIMESLLYKTLENYKRTSNRVLSSDPTLLDYLAALKRFNLIDRRQSNRIKAAFAIRNSISHFNEGFTEVSDIQSMLHGIENIYTTLFLPSLKWKESHPNRQLSEPDRQNK